jgi:hypothetical protein
MGWINTFGLQVPYRLTPTKTLISTSASLTRACLSQTLPSIFSRNSTSLSRLSILHVRSLSLCNCRRRLEIVLLCSLRRSARAESARVCPCLIPGVLQFDSLVFSGEVSACRWLCSDFTGDRDSCRIWSLAWPAGPRQVGLALVERRR